MKRAVLLVSVWCLLWHGERADAMEFRVGAWKGHPAIFATGAIKEGDAQRLRDVASRVSPAMHGFRILLLHSPGGSVGEALKITEEFESLKIHTIIQKGQSCDSSCGAIVFIGGLLRTIEEGGQLGLHTCYRADTGVPSAACNEMIAMNAVGHGVSHGSLKGAMDSTPPDRLTKLSRQSAECWGLVRYAGTEASGFDRLEPCVMRIITGKELPAQAAWRLDLDNEGISAFVRTFNDYALPGQIKLSCGKAEPGSFELQVLVPGPVQKVRQSIVALVLLGLKTAWSTERFAIAEVQPDLSEVRVNLPGPRVSELASSARAIELRLDLKLPYNPMIFRTHVEASRVNLRTVVASCGKFDRPGIVGDKR